MLKDKDAIATIAVKDLKKARAFYEGILGFTIDSPDCEEVLTFKSGSSLLFVYRSEFAGTNKATCANWLVGDEIEAIVKTLRSKGVSFEHYDLPGLTLQGDIHSGSGMKVAWFKDPDGNILSIVGE